MGFYIHSPLLFLVFIFILVLAFDLWGEAIKVSVRKKWDTDRNPTTLYILAIIFTALFFLGIHFFGFPLSMFEGSELVHKR